MFTLTDMQVSLRPAATFSSREWLSQSSLLILNSRFLRSRALPSSLSRALLSCRRDDAPCGFLTCALSRPMFCILFTGSTPEILHTSTSIRSQTGSNYSRQEGYLEKCFALLIVASSCFIHSSKFPIPISVCPVYLWGRVSLASRFGVSICGALRDPRHVWAGALLIENGEMLQISNFFLESTIFATRMCLYTFMYHLTRAHVGFFCFPELFKPNFFTYTIN